MAHKKGQGSSRNGRDSNGQRRGMKAYGGERVSAGTILVRQVGTSIHAGRHVGGVHRPGRPVADPLPPHGNGGDVEHLHGRRRRRLRRDLRQRTGAHEQHEHGDRHAKDDEAHDGACQDRDEEAGAGHWI